MTLKVYGLDASPCTGRVIAAIFEKEVEDWELVPVNLLTGEHKQPAFVAKQVHVRIFFHCQQYLLASTSI